MLDESKLQVAWHQKSREAHPDHPGGSAALAAELLSLLTLAGLPATASGHYPGWTPNPDSPLLALCQRVYAQRFGGALDAAEGKHDLGKFQHRIDVAGVRFGRQDHDSRLRRRRNRVRPPA